MAVCLQEVFERVNKAYEFLCSRAKFTQGPDPKNIVLILQAQSILFSRYSEGQSFPFPPPIQLPPRPL